MDIAEAQEAVAKEYGFSLYRSYGERVTARLIGVDYSTLKRWRRAGQVNFVRRGRGVRYMGFHIVDMLMQGTQPKTEPLEKKLHFTGNGVSATRFTDDHSSDVSALARSIILRRRKEA